MPINSTCFDWLKAKFIRERTLPISIKFLEIQYQFNQNDYNDNDKSRAHQMRSYRLSEGE